MLTEAARRTTRATVAALDRQRAADPNGDERPLSGREVRALMLENARLQRELAAALAQIARLEAENDTLAARAAARRAYELRASDSPSPLTGRGSGGGVLTIDGRPVVNQTQAAQQLGVKQYQISRWVAAGHFQTVRVGSRTLIYADTLHKPAPKQRRKKGGS